MSTCTVAAGAAGGKPDPRFRTVSAPGKRRVSPEAVSASARRRCHATTASVSTATATANASAPAKDRHRCAVRSGGTVVPLHRHDLGATREEALEEHGLVAVARPDRRRAASLADLVRHVAPDGEYQRDDERDEDDRREQYVDGHDCSCSESADALELPPAHLHVEQLVHRGE